MPISNQAKKRMRSDERKALQNKKVLSKLKTLKKKHQTIEDKANAEKHARLIYKEYDKAASKGIIPKGRASRIKARLAKRLITLAK